MKSWAPRRRQSVVTAAVAAVAVGNARTIIHIGVGKTGTSTLQRNLFARHKGIFNIGRPYANDEFKVAIESLRDDDDADYRTSALANLCCGAASQADGRALVLSDETLVHPVHQSVIARRLHSVLPESHVLITIRNQYDLIASYWAAHGRNLKDVPPPYRGKLVPFDEWFAFEAKAKRGFFLRLDFCRLHQIYAEIFGEDRLHVMTFEALAGNPDAFARELTALLGVDEKEMSELINAVPAKVRPSAMSTRYQALRGRFLPKVAFSRLPGGVAIRRAIHRFVQQGPALNVTFTPAQRAFIRERFGPSNEVLAAKIDIDLVSLRYPSRSDPILSKQHELTFAASAPGGHA